MALFIRFPHGQKSPPVLILSCTQSKHCTCCPLVTVRSIYFTNSLVLLGSLQIECVFLHLCTWTADGTILQYLTMQHWTTQTFTGPKLCLKEIFEISCEKDTPAELHCPACPPDPRGSPGPPADRTGLSCCQWCWGWSCAGWCCRCPTQTDWSHQSPHPARQVMAAAPCGLPAGSLSVGCTS